jgi:hypothetical protein
MSIFIYSLAASLIFAIGWAVGRFAPVPFMARDVVLALNRACKRANLDPGALMEALGSGVDCPTRSKLIENGICAIDAFVRIHETAEDVEEHGGSHDIGMLMVLEMDRLRAALLANASLVEINLAAILESPPEFPEFA